MFSISEEARTVSPAQTCVICDGGIEQIEAGKRFLKNRRSLLLGFPEMNEHESRMQSIERHEQWRQEERVQGILYDGKLDRQLLHLQDPDAQVGQDEEGKDLTQGIGRPITGPDETGLSCHVDDHADTIHEDDAIDEECTGRHVPHRHQVADDHADGAEVGRRNCDQREEAGQDVRMTGIASAARA